MRIVSLLGSATEIVFELGLQSHLVGISHECDFPPETRGLPRVSRPRFDPAGLSSGEIDAAVRRCMEEFGGVYEIDRELLAKLAPDVVLTQAVCEVCAVPTGSVEEAVGGLKPGVQVISLDAHTLSDILDTLRQVADAVGEPARGEAAVRRMVDRLDTVDDAIAGRETPRVLFLEWLDPPFAPGHWVPEMVSRAGGVNLVGEAGRPSREIAWADLSGLDPDCLLIEPCGYDLAGAREDADRNHEALAQLAAAASRSRGSWVLHSAWFSRSGPRVVGGIEALARILHPEVLPDVTPGRAERWISLRTDSGAPGSSHSGWG